MTLALTEDARSELIARLRRIEGQTQGIQRMLLEGRDCREVLNQLASVRAATHQASLELLRHYARACLSEPGQSGRDVNEMLELLLNSR